MHRSLFGASTPEIHEICIKQKSNLSNTPKDKLIEVIISSMQLLPKSEHTGATLLLASALYVYGRTVL